MPNWTAGFDNLFDYRKDRESEYDTLTAALQTDINKKVEDQKTSVNTAIDAIITFKDKM